MAIAVDKAKFAEQIKAKSIVILDDNRLRNAIPKKKKEN